MAKLKGILLLSLLITSLSIAFVPKLSVGQQLPVVYVHPTPIDAEVDVSFPLEIKIKYASNVYAWEITLFYNASVLDFVNATEGSFLKGLEETQTYMATPVVRARAADPSQEEVVLACTRLGAGIMGASGSADLVKIFFKVLALGETDLTLTNTKLRDHVPDPIEHTSLNGFFSNIAGFPKPDFTFTPAKANVGETVTFDASSSVDTDQGLEHFITDYFWDFGDGTNASETVPITYHAYTAGGVKDVTLQVTDNDRWNKSITKAVKVRFDYDVMIVEVTQSVQNATVGESITVFVEVGNEGANDLSGVTVKAFYTSTPIGDAQTTSLIVDQRKTLSYVWDTTGMAAGNYRIKGVVDVVAGEPEDAQADNEQLGGTIALREPVQTPWALYAGIIAVVAIVVIVAFLLLRRRGGKKQAPKS
jgi:PKD repeat protein